MALREDLEAVWRHYVHAYRNGDTTGCAACFADDAVLISPFGPVARGRDEIAAAHAEWTEEAGAARKSITILEHGGNDTLSWCLVRFSEADAGEDGTSLNVLERQPGGDWLIRMCSLNASVA